MSDLAERLAPLLDTGALLHPGDADTPPFPLKWPIEVAGLPEGQLADLVDDMELPTSNINQLYLEALFALINAKGYEITPATELAELRTAAAANEPKRNPFVTFHTPCGATLRVMVRDFNTEHPHVPCELVKHECKAGR